MVVAVVGGGVRAEVRHNMEQGSECEERKK